MDETIHIRGESIPLSALLKLAGCVGSGGEAKLLIREGQVQVDGAVELRPGAKVRPGTVVRIDGTPAACIRVRGETDSSRTS